VPPQRLVRSRGFSPPTAHRPSFRPVPSLGFRPSGSRSLGRSTLSGPAALLGLRSPGRSCPDRTVPVRQAWLRERHGRFEGRDPGHGGRPLQGRYRASLPAGRLGLFTPVVRRDPPDLFLPGGRASITGGPPDVLILSWTCHRCRECIDRVLQSILQRPKGPALASRSPPARFLTLSKFP
jgi:hypothetical protein